MSPLVFLSIPVEDTSGVARQKNVLVWSSMQNQQKLLSISKFLIMQTKMLKRSCRSLLKGVELDIRPLGLLIVTKYMKVREKEFRIQTATLARQVCSGDLNFFDFLKQVGPEGDPYCTGDDEVDELINLLEHQPKEGGFGGANKKEYAAYMEDIDALIEELEHSS
jgi:hypothetical protein